MRSTTTKGRFKSNHVNNNINVSIQFKKEIVRLDKTAKLNGMLSIRDVFCKYLDRLKVGIDKDIHVNNRHKKASS